MFDELEEDDEIGSDDLTDPHLSAKGKLIIGQKLLFVLSDDFVFEAIKRTRKLKNEGKPPNVFRQVVRSMLIERRNFCLLLEQSSIPFVIKESKKMGVKPIVHVFNCVLFHVLSIIIDLGEEL